MVHRKGQKTEAVIVCKMSKEEEEEEKAQKGL